MKKTFQMIALLAVATLSACSSSEDKTAVKVVEEKPLVKLAQVSVRPVEQIQEYTATVEAEVGQIGVSEDGEKEGERIYSDPQEVKRLKEETGVDAIALSIGNAHGLYKDEPKLNFDVLRKTRELTGMPLVLHGGTGISEEDFRCCIQNGIRKINVATGTFMAVEQAAREYAAEEKRDYFRLSAHMAELAYENVKKHIRIFGSEGKAR